jgi:hypothetical protein
MAAGLTERSSAVDDEAGDGPEAGIGSVTPVANYEETTLTRAVIARRPRRRSNLDRGWPPSP